MTPLPDSSPRRRWLLPLVVSLASLWPLLRNWTAFHQLFYFEDEWDLIDLWDKVGFSSWCTTVFAENFVPLFKLLWGGAIVLSQGSYFTLVVLVWLTHALNVFLLARISRRLGADPAGAALAALVFGLAAVNCETLAWTVQWSAVLSYAFFLLGLSFVVEWSTRAVAPAWRHAALLGLCALASVLCFSRGVLTGGALALWPLFAAGKPLRRLGLGCLPLAPSILVGAWIFTHSSGNHQHLGATLHSMFLWALHYYAQSPLRTLFSDATPGLPVIVILAAVKSALFAAGLVLAPRSLRPALLALLAFELGNALLLGFGRYHTGLPAATSSRYQYGALATLLPFVAIVFSRVSAFLIRPALLRRVATGAVVLAVVWLVQRPWPDALAGWTPWRGGETRAVLFGVPPAPEPEHLARVPWISNERARLLVRKYHLH